MYNEELYKLYEEHGAFNQSYEDWLDDYLQDREDRREYNELNRDDEYYSNVD